VDGQELRNNPPPPQHLLFLLGFRPLQACSEASSTLTASEEDPEETGSHRNPDARTRRRCLSAPLPLRRYHPRTACVSRLASIPCRSRVGRYAMVRSYGEANSDDFNADARGVLVLVYVHLRVVIVVVVGPERGFRRIHTLRCSVLLLLCFAASPTSTNTLGRINGGMMSANFPPDEQRQASFLDGCDVPL